MDYLTVNYFVKNIKPNKQNTSLIDVHLFKRTMLFAYGVWST